MTSHESTAALLASLASQVQEGTVTPTQALQTFATALGGIITQLPVEDFGAIEGRLLNDGEEGVHLVTSGAGHDVFEVGATVNLPGADQAEPAIVVGRSVHTRAALTRYWISKELE